MQNTQRKSVKHLVYNYIYQINNLKVIVGAFQNFMVGYPTYVGGEHGHTLFYIYSAENDHEQL